MPREEKPAWKDPDVEELPKVVLGIVEHVLAGVMYVLRAFSRGAIVCNAHAPLAEESPLWQLPRVLHTPHKATGY